MKSIEEEQSLLELYLKLSVAEKEDEDGAQMRSHEDVMKELRESIL